MGMENGCIGATVYYINQKLTGKCGVFLENKKQNMVLLFEIDKHKYCSVLHSNAVCLISVQY